jgi:hypothetical protein
MTRTGSGSSMSSHWKWFLALAFLGMALVIYLGVAAKGRQSKQAHGSVHTANPEKAKATKPGTERQRDQSPSRKTPERPSETASSARIETPEPEPVAASPVEEADMWPPEVIVGEESETWSPEVAGDESAGIWTPEATGEGSAGTWRPLIILPPGVTAEFEDSPEGAPQALDNQAPRSITRSPGRSGGGAGRGRR